MSIVGPSATIVQFWLMDIIKQQNGTPPFVEKSVEILKRAKKDIISEGLEFFLMPSRLTGSRDFSNSFYKQLQKINYKSVHIHEYGDFRFDDPSVYTGFQKLSRILERMGINRIVIHANFFHNRIRSLKQFLDTLLPNVDILVENNGFDHDWGGSVKGLEKIFSNCPDYGFCLDIAHVKDFAGHKLRDFTQNPILGPRIAQIHYSYSTILIQDDPYEQKGIPGYAPYHALFSLTDCHPSKATLDFISKYPVIIEGLLPVEDAEFVYLTEEIDRIKSYNGKEEWN